MGLKSYKPKDIFIEFVIVILGITIAFWLSNLGEQKKERRLEAVYLADIRTDLSEDQKALSYSLRENKVKLDKLLDGVSYYQSNGPKIRLDSLAGYSQLIGNYFHFTPNDYTYISLQQSGDFKIIEDNSLKKALVGLYQHYKLIEAEQKNLLEALDQNYFPTLMSKYDMLSGELEDQDYFESAAFKNTLVFTLNETRTLIRLYEIALKKIEALQSEHLD